MDELGQILFAIVFIVAMFFLAAWLMKDAEERGKPGCLVVLLVLALNLPGLLIWLIFRPAKPSETPPKKSPPAPVNDPDA